MAYGMQDLRARNFFDQMTPSYGGGGIVQPSLSDQGGYAPAVQDVLDPTGQPLNQGQPTLAPPRVGADNNTTETQELINAINQVYSPEYTSRDRFNRLLDNFPSAYEPTKTDRFTAAMMGLGAGGRQGGDSIKTMDYVLQGPRMRDIEEWKLKSDPFGKAAQYENTANANERTLAGNVVTGIYNQGRNRIAQERNQMYYDIQTVRNHIAEIRARGGNVRVDFSGPTVMVYENGVARDTGVETGKMREVDKINLQNAGRIQSARVMGENAARTAEIREGIYTEDSAGNISRMEGIEKTPVPRLPGEKPPFKVLGSGVGRGQTQKEIDDARRAGLEAEFSRNPGKYDFAVGINEFGNYAMKPPPPAPDYGFITHITGKGAQQWREYKEKMKIYNEAKRIMHPNEPPEPIAGETSPTSGASRGTSSQYEGTVEKTTKSKSLPPGTSSAGRTPGPVPAGHTRVYDAQGNYKGYVPNSRLEEARMKGLTPR